MEKSIKINATLKKGVLNNKKYTLKALDAPIKLNQNESPYDLPKQVKNKILKKMQDIKWNIYPDFIPEKLYKNVAGFYNLKPENILIGNGSNEMIFTILAATLESGKTFVLPQPTFTVYGLIAGNLNAEIKNVMLNEDMSFNVDNIIKEAKTPGSVTVLCSPNNPTGTSLKYNDIKNIIAQSNGIVVVDEAYIQFGGESVLNLINEFENLIVLRTFSKVFGLAGLRIGIMISNEEIIRELSKVKLPYNLNILVTTALETLIENANYVDENIQMILDQKKFLEIELSKFKELKITPSDANFFLIKVNDSKWLMEKLLEHGILVRDVSSYPMLSNRLRISVGNKKENQALINSLNDIFK